MKLIFCMLLAATIGIVASLPASADSTDPKLVVCSGQEYFTNTGENNGDVFPNLHCGDSWLTYNSDKDSLEIKIVFDGKFSTENAATACLDAQRLGARSLSDRIALACFGYTGEVCLPNAIPPNPCLSGN